MSLKPDISCDHQQASLMEELATVVGYDNGWVNVEVELKSACNHCQNSDNCGTSTIAKAFSVKTQQFSLPSERVCEVGEMIKIGLPESVIIKAAALVYLLPLAGLFIFGFAGQLLAYSLDVDPNTLAILLATVGAVIGWLIGKSTAKKLENDAQPVIIQYLGRQLLAAQEHQLPSEDGEK